MTSRWSCKKSYQKKEKSSTRKVSEIETHLLHLTWCADQPSSTAPCRRWLVPSVTPAELELDGLLPSSKGRTGQCLPRKDPEVWVLLRVHSFLSFVKKWGDCKCAKSSSL